jgi:uncharacterized membrane protein
MEPAYIAMLLAVVFAGTHVGLATLPVRTRIVAQLGEQSFRWLFFGVAALSFTLLIVYYAEHRTAGAPGPALGTFPALRAALMSVAVIGVTLMAASFAAYPGGPYEHAGTARPARGLERVTRHPFFVGMILFAGAHSLLATRLIGSVLMLALGSLALVGSRHQDAKLARLRDRSFADYLASTSVAPFAAILRGRQQLVWREIPWGAVVAGLAIAAGLRQAHEDIFAHHGAWVLLVNVGGALAIMVASQLRDQRRARRHARTA